MSDTYCPFCEKGKTDRSPAHQIRYAIYYCPFCEKDESIQAWQDRKKELGVNRKPFNPKKELGVNQQPFNPADNGPEAASGFSDQMQHEFEEFTNNEISLDELLLHPAMSLHFCNVVRQKWRMFQVSDDHILRTLMSRRKSPAD